jgi:hypothetical protein
MPDKNLLAAVYNAHQGAEKAVKELQTSGFDMKKLSIVGKSPRVEEHTVEFDSMGDRTRSESKTGVSAAGFWGGISGVLLGAAMFAIPGVGPVRAAGPVVAWIAGVLESAVVVGGLGVIGAGLYRIGLPKNSVLEYELALKADRYLLLIHGTPEEAAKANEILKGTEPAKIHQYYPLQHQAPPDLEPPRARKV